MSSTPPYTCVSLFAGLGGFCQAFRGDPNWDVIAIDATDTFERTATINLDPYGIEELKFKTTTTFQSYRTKDVLDLEAQDLPRDIDLLLAGPPCTTLSIASASHHREPTSTKHPKTAKAAWHDRLLYHLYNLIHELDPEYYLVENPRGNMRTIAPFGSPDFETTLCQWGSDRQKPTDFWGELPGFTPGTCNAGDDCHEAAPRGSKTGTQGLQTPADRALMPRALSQEIKRCATAALSGTPPRDTLAAFTTEQATDPDRGMGVKPYCEYCGTARTPGKVWCCGHPLMEPLESARPCGDGHYTAHPDACPFCAFENAPYPRQDLVAASPYLNWNHSADLPDDLPNPGSVITVDRTTYWVPEGWGVVSFTDPETHFTHEDFDYEIEFTAVAAVPPSGHAYEIDRTASVEDEYYPETAPPVPRKPAPDARPDGDTAYLGAPPWSAPSA